MVLHYFFCKFDFLLTNAGLTNKEILHVPAKSAREVRIPLATSTLSKVEILVGVRLLDSHRIITIASIAMPGRTSHVLVHSGIS